MTAPFLGNCRILENREVAPVTFLMRLDAPVVASQGRPGQFVMIRTGPGPETGSGPLLKRPLSIHRLGPGTEISLLYRVVGAGTSWLSQTRPGEQLEILGPLGRGFDLALTRPRAYLVAGGMGLAPVLALAEAAAAQAELTLFFGETTHTDMLGAGLPHGSKYFRHTVFSTDDGSFGRSGLITAPLAEALIKAPAPVLACGPWPMVKEVARLVTAAGVPGQVSLEAHMACGLGVCLGCVVEVKTTNPQPAFARVCSEGPVFDIREVKWP